MPNFNDQHEALLNTLGVNNRKAESLLKTSQIEDFNVPFWFYSHCTQRGWRTVSNTKNLIEAFQLLQKTGHNINGFFKIKDGDYSIAHILADCHGSKFMIDFTHGQMSYMEVFTELLEQGLDVHKINSQNINPMDIANQTEEEFGLGTSMFKRIYGSWKLKSDLEKSLAAKPMAKTDGGKL